MTADLTVDEVERAARNQGWSQFADWIASERGRRAKAQAEALAAPLITPGGVIEVGKWYDVTARKYGKERRYKRVTLTREGRYGYPALVYASRATAKCIYGKADIESITAVAEVPA